MYTNTESIGCVAHKILYASPTASVIGRTSRGIFLLTTSKKVLFISYEPHRGPLTINAAHKINNVGLSTQIIDSHLFIGDAAICISTPNLWQPEPLPSTLAPLPTRIATLQHFLNHAAALRSNFKFQTSNFKPPNHLTTQPPDHLISNLGLGPGLTPSHDDIVIGFLLTLNRYGRCPHNDLIIKEAHARTTTLSANLIECAAHGLADERLIRVVDCIFTGDKNDHALDEMLGWGETSGVYALIGISIAVETLHPEETSLQQRGEI
jgi:hypothetical protein